MSQNPGTAMETQDLCGLRASAVQAQTSSDSAAATESGCVQDALHLPFSLWPTCTEQTTRR